MLALDSVCLLITQFHLVYLQTSYVTKLPLYPLSSRGTTPCQRTDCTTARKMGTSKSISLSLDHYLWGPSYTSLFVHIHTSMAVLRRNIVRNPWRVIIHGIVLKCKVKLWATHISVAKRTKLKITLWRVNFLPFSGLAQMLFQPRVFRREMRWKVHFYF